MTTLAFLHGYGARLLVIFAVLLALWGTYHYFRNQRLSGGFRSTHLIMAGLAPGQGLLRLAALILRGHPPGNPPHLLFGAVPPPVPPRAYPYLHRGRARRRTPGL